MPYLGALRTVFQEAKIERVAIVDDAYDKIDFADIEQEDFVAAQTELRDRIEEPNEHRELLEELNRLTGRAAAELAETIRDRLTCELLWNAFVQSEPSGTVREVLAPLFRIMGTDRADKLRPLHALKRLLLSIEGVSVDELDSNTQPADVAGHQLIFLDFYLRKELPAREYPALKGPEKTEARKRSIEFLAKLVADQPDRIPAVMLISSIATAEHLSEFRRSAKMLASKLSFLPKNYAESDPARTQHTIIGLLQHLDKADALQKLLATWHVAVTEATQSLMISARELDLTEYSYIQQYRLAGEKTPLAQYIAWLLNGRLTDLVEQNLRKAGADKIVRDLSLADAIPGRVSPTQAISEILSAVTTTRIPIEDEGFETPPIAWAGDIFLATKTYNRIFGRRRPEKRATKRLPEVLTVITPACDLIPDRAVENPLKAVTMIGGKLVELSETAKATHHMLMLNGKPYVIEWDTKWPVTTNLSAMVPGQGPYGRYEWVGRYRDLYHAELQSQLFRDVGRVGLPIAPPLPEWVALRVLAKVENRPARFEIVLECDAEKQCAWTMIGIKDKMYCLRADIVWQVREWVDNRQVALAEAERAALRRLLDHPRFVEQLERPVAIRKGPVSLECGVSYEQALDPASVDSGQAPLVVVFAKSSQVTRLAA